MDYFSLVNSWSRVFGEDHVLPRIYDRKLLMDGDICKDFLGLLGVTELSNFSFPSILESNPSIGGPLLKFKLLLNYVSEWDERSLMLKTYRVLQACAAREERFRAKKTVGRELERKVRAKYRESNKALFEKYFPYSEGFCIKTDRHEGGLEEEWLTVEDFEYICTLFEEYCEEAGAEYASKDVVDVHYNKMRALLV